MCMNMMPELTDEDTKKLQDFVSFSEGGLADMIGYPGTHYLDFTPLYPLLNTMLNNIGDPYRQSGSMRQHSHEFEREVIEWFKHLLHAKDTVPTWGYVTTGGTEGNMYGVYMAREKFPDGIVYYSEDSHYSVAKILKMARARSIMIKSREDGEIDYQDLAETISIHRDVPPIIFANIGTTMRGAIDNIDTIKNILREKAISQYYIHSDAALSGMILPFTDDPQPFDFSAGVDSIAISGHKMPGAPMPCGIVLAKQEHVDRITRSVEYIGTMDTTITGSRNGLSPVFLWYIIKSLGIDGFRDMVQTCMECADYAIAQFEKAGIKAWRHRNSLTVVFPLMNKPALNKWQIATKGNEAHLITMPHVTAAHINGFIQDLIS